MLGTENGAAGASDEDDGQQSSKSTEKRRRSLKAKNKQSKLYKCGCEKSYLSYQALYTHIKTKHAGVFPSGTSLPQPAVRKRGRPRKYPLPEGATAAKENQETAENSSKDPSPPDSDHNKDPPVKIHYSSEEALRALGVAKGDRCDALAICENFVKKLASDGAKAYRTLVEQLKEASKESKDHPSELGSKKTCQKIFGEYLGWMAERVNEKAFERVLIFVRSFLDYMNLKGWDYLRKRRTVTDVETEIAFAKQNDASCIPEAANDFCRNYIRKECPHFDQSISIGLTLDLCDWLHSHKYTTVRLVPL